MGVRSFCLLLTVIAAMCPITPAHAEEPSIAVAVAEELVNVRANFTGADVIVFGGVRGMRPDDEILVALQGPSRPARVMRKSRKAGVWVNADPVTFDAAPSYFATATTGEEKSAFTPTPQFSTPRSTAPNELADYRAAAIRLLRERGLFREETETVLLLDSGLFRASMEVPPGAPAGLYAAEAFLVRDGVPIARQQTELRFARAGLERWVYDLAHRRPLLYGLICVALAVAAGYGAAAAFRR